MWQPLTETPGYPGSNGAADRSWNIVAAAAQLSETLARQKRAVSFTADRAGALREVAASDDGAVIAWHPDTGWDVSPASSDCAHALIDLYLPICSATTRRPIIIGHLGQSLDGFIATHAGESRWVTGPENVLHSHRLRALSDAVVVGAGTVAADDPQLTTRLVPGPNPLRVILDPGRRLGEYHRVFNDDDAESIYVCARSLVRPGERTFGRAAVAGVGESPSGGIDVAEVGQLLHQRGCTRVFVEGGGVTVSMFLEAGLLDRLHVAVAPILIGNGRPAIRLPARAALGDCHRPQYRVFRMGPDVLFDCDLRAGHNTEPCPTEPSVERII